MTKDNPPQQFQPLSRLPLVRSISEGQLGDLRTLRRKLAGACTQPHVFDDATIDRVIRVHTETLGFLPYTRRQLDHWDDARPSACERETIQRIHVETDKTEQLMRECSRWRRRSRPARSARCWRRTTSSLAGAP